MEEQEINILAVMQVLVKRKMVIIITCSVAIVASVIYSLTLPNIYSATAKVLPPQKEAGGGVSALLGQAGGLAGLVAGGLGGGSDLFVAILKSRSVGDAVINRLDLTKVYKAQTLDAARSSLDGAVKIQAGKDGIITITAEDKDPKRAAQLANTFIQELGKTTVRLNLSKAGTERLFLEKRLDLVKKDLLAAEEDLKSFSQRNKIVLVESQAGAAITGIARLKSEIASKEVQLAVLRGTRTKDSPEVKALQTAITRMNAELGNSVGSGGDGGGIPSIGNVPGIGLEYKRKVRDMKTQEAILEQLTKQYEIAKLSEAKDSSSFQVLDDAVVPVYKSKPRRSLVVLFSTMIAFFASLLTVFVLEYLERMSDDDRKVLQGIKRQLLSLR